jgi:toxin-antitoxin system PIN domain toxin
MIAVDTNILVYAHRQDAEFHQIAVQQITKLAQGQINWAIPWHCLHEFFAIVTHPRIYDPPSSTRQAIEQINAWLETPTLVLLTETTQHWQQLAELLSAGAIVGPMVHDARVAALCLQHGVQTLWTLDRDFSRFPSLSSQNPLKSAVVKQHKNGVQGTPSETL